MERSFGIFLYIVSIFSWAFLVQDICLKCKYIKDKYIVAMDIVSAISILAMIIEEITSNNGYLTHQMIVWLPFNIMIPLIMLYKNRAIEEKFDTNEILKQYKYVLDNFPLPTCIKTDNGTIIYSNISYINKYGNNQNKTDEEFWGKYGKIFWENSKYVLENKTVKTFYEEINENGDGVICTKFSTSWEGKDVTFYIEYHIFDNNHITFNIKNEQK